MLLLGHLHLWVSPQHCWGKAKNKKIYGLDVDENSWAGILTPGAWGLVGRWREGGLGKGLGLWTLSGKSGNEVGDEAGAWRALVVA